MEEILEKVKRVAEAAEVFLVTSEETPVQFEANRLKHIQSKQSQIVALRIIRKGRTGYGITTDPNDADRLVEAAVETAEFGMPARFEFPSADTYPKVEVWDKEVKSVPLERMIEQGEEMIAAVRQESAGIVCEAAVSRDIISVNFFPMLNSKGYPEKVFDAVRLPSSNTPFPSNKKIPIGES